MSLSPRASISRSSIAPTDSVDSTSCRNMIAAGVPQTVAMKISGHKTDSIFRRYAIVSTDDMRRALQMTQEHLASVKEKVVAMPRMATVN